MIRRHFVLFALFSAAAIARADTFVRSDVSLPTGPNVVDIAVGDLTGDELPEIVTADRGELSSPLDERPGNDQLSYFVADGPLKYSAQPQLRTGFGPHALKIVNIDALRAPDIVAVSFMAVRGADLTLFRNLGDNLFEPREFAVPDDDLGYARMLDGDGEPVFTTPGLTAVEVFDFDGDGYRDAIATAWSSDVLLYFPGHISDYFQTPRTIPLDGAPRDLVRGDFNRDGHQDIAAALYAKGEVALLYGDGKGGFALGPAFDSRGELPIAIDSADFDADGIADLAVAHAHADDSVVLFRGDPAAPFTVSQEILLGEDRRVIETEIRGIAIDDFDRNGRPDIAAAGFASRELVVLLNRAAEGFPWEFSRESYAFKNGRPRAVAAADLNGDGRTDLVVSAWETNRLEFFLGR